MEIYTMKRPSLSPMSVWALSATGMPIVAARRAPLSRVHQVQIQAELAQVLAYGYESDSTKVTLKGREGFVGSNGKSVTTDLVSGVPPRGRPV